VWVAVLGLSVWALIGGLASLDPVRVRSKFTGRPPLRSTSVVLIAIGSVFYLLWLSEIVPATLSGTIPEALAEAGLPTNPVHVLDLALFLPAAVVAGGLLARRRALGYVLAPVVLVAMACTPRRDRGRSAQEVPPRNASHDGSGAPPSGASRTRAPADRISSRARSPSPGSRSTALIPSVRTETSYPSRVAPRAVSFTQ